jgi:hypothetical protein
MPDWLYGLLMFVLGAAFEHYRFVLEVRKRVRLEVARQMRAHDDGL